MLRPGVAKRYARAFYEVAKAEKTADVFASDLKLITASLSSHVALQQFLTSPLIPGMLKQERMSKIFGQFVHVKTMNLMQVLIASGREAYISQIEAEFTRYLADDLGIAEADVESVIPLTDEQVEKLSRALSKEAGKSVHCEVRINPSLIGGLKIRLGDRVIDHSVLGRLEEFRKRLNDRTLVNIAAKE